MQRSNTARSDFALAVAQIAHERGLDAQVVLDSIKQALIAAFKKDHSEAFKEDAFYDVDLDSGTGEAHVYETEGDVVETDGVTTVTPKPGAKRVDITPPGYGRIAAQTAKQVILQKVREAEKSQVVSEYQKRIGSLVSGMIIRFVGQEIIVDIGKAEAVMPKEEQIHSEDYRLSSRMTFLVHSIRDSVRGQEVVVSRADAGIIRELFKREVPEVASGAVEVKAIARDPGSRTKIAVYSNQPGVDPVGSCVGQKGVRVQAVIGELNGEKIDIVQYSGDQDKFVAAALSPAAGLTVKINDKTGIAQVTAPTDQLSLAIGREGQNAKLAGKLVGLHIDIKGSEKATDEIPAEEGTSEKKEETSSTDDSNTPVASTNDQ